MPGHSADCRSKSTTFARRGNAMDYKRSGRARGARHRAGSDRHRRPALTLMQLVRGRAACESLAVLRRRRAALTLVELLVVMGVLVMLAAITLPTVKGMLSDQKVSQAATLVQQYCEAARSRAIATGRPVAVIFDRLRYDAGGGATPLDALVANNTCVRMSTGEVFPPYAGDWAGAVGRLEDSNADGVVDRLRIPVAQAASLIDTSVTPAVPSGMALAGDMLQLGARRETFLISADPSLDASTAEVLVPFFNPPLTSVGTNTFSLAEPATWMNGTTVRFRIFRRPSKSLAGGTSLPRGTCIDMHFSGFGTAGREFSSDSIHLTAGTPAPSYPPTPPYSQSNGNPDYGPIYIVFSPDGTVEAWYYQNRALSVTAPVFQRAAPTTMIHLLVGRTDGVPQSPLVDPAGALAAGDTFTSNIMDTLNSWVTINPYTGHIYTSPVNGVTVPAPGLSDPVLNRLAQARTSATFGIADTNP
ncbi:MAG: hypothetical protein D6753_05315 [Planctomycetota bacterium]|nr:MAG: hypothetical protein D6753_05315 [Planctomycetota bacterium]